MILLLLLIWLDPISTQLSFTCTTNAQCFNGSFYCDVSQLCQPKSCTSFSQCANGFICSNILKCIPGTNYCALNTQCPVNFYCTGTICLPNHCLVNTDCTRFLLGTYCNAYGQCLPTACIDSTQCPGNYTCNATTSQCTPNSLVVALPTMAPPTSMTDTERLNLTIFGIVYIIVAIIFIAIMIILFRYRKRSDIIETRASNNNNQQQVKKKPATTNSILRVNKKTK